LSSHCRERVSPGEHEDHERSKPDRSRSGKDGDDNPERSRAHVDGPSPLW
jgi:hypothetical protein